MFGTKEIQEYFSSKLNPTEVLYGFCSAFEKKNLIVSLLQSKKPCYLVGISNKGIHLYCDKDPQKENQHEFYLWDNLQNITFRFAGPQALLSFEDKNKNKCKFLLQIEKSNDYLELNKKAIVFLMMKGSG